MEDGPCGEPHEGGQFCMSHSDCSGDAPFCYEHHCDVCEECHFCHDGVDGTCGSCGDGFPTMEDGPCGEPHGQLGGCPAYCVYQWIGDNICDMYDCEVCDHFTVNGVFDGGDCEGGYDGGDYEGGWENLDNEARTSIMLKATKSFEKAVGRSRFSKQAIKAYMSKMAKTRKSAEKAVAQTSSSCSSHDDCSGDTPFCFEHHCDVCEECHFCHDGVDGTCGSCGDGFPTMEDGPCGEPHGQFCMSHSDCQGDTPFCYEYQCDSCAECHFCHDGVDGTCGSCGVGGCPAYCVDEWIGDNICDMYDCDVCDHFTVDGVFDGGDCEGGYDGGDYEGGDACMSHSDCSGDTPFCYESHCDSCAECHYCLDGVDGTCGSCGDGFPLYEDTCGTDGDSDCPSMCIPQWVGDGWCDDGIVYHVDCTKCEHFTD